MALPLESHPSDAEQDPGEHGAKPGSSPPAWPLEAFDRSLRAPQHLTLLLRLLGPVTKERCLFLSYGDDGGALAFHLRLAGGTWRWATLTREGGEHTARLLGEGVQVVDPGTLPYCDATFHRVICVGVHDRISAPATLNREIARILVPGGQAVVSVPNGNPRLPMKLLRRTRRGTPGEPLVPRTLEASMSLAGLVPTASGGCSRFFTELLESFGGPTAGPPAKARNGHDHTAANEESGSPPDARSAGREPRRRSRLLRAFASLDYLIPGGSGYVIAVGARKPGPAPTASASPR